MDTAPKDRTIIGNYGNGEHASISWSDRPVCMGGPTVYHKPGWATPAGGVTDSNLPMDAPESWCEEEEYNL